MDDATMISHLTYRAIETLRGRDRSDDDTDIAKEISGADKIVRVECIDIRGSDGGPNMYGKQGWTDCGVILCIDEHWEREEVPAHPHPRYEMRLHAELRGLFVSLDHDTIDSPYIPYEALPPDVRAGADSTMELYIQEQEEEEWKRNG